MYLLGLGLAVFFAAHVFPLAAATRGQLVARIGVGGYKGLFSLVSILGLVLIIIGYRHAETGHLYDPPPQARGFAHALMPFVLILLAGANMKSNLKRYVRHPMSLGVLLWSIVHLTANGDVASVVLFGAFGLYALLDMFVIAGPTVAPPAAPRIKDAMLIVAGLTGYALAIYLHGVLGPAVVG